MDVSMGVKRAVAKTVVVSKTVMMSMGASMGLEGALAKTVMVSMGLEGAETKTVVVSMGLEVLMAKGFEDTVSREISVDFQKKSFTHHIIIL